MHLKFFKYQGTGNDFIMLDNRRGEVGELSRGQIEKCCDRRFGIGADGLILLENCPDADFKMVYYNSDGRESTMCGNGGRCLVKFAADLGIRADQYKFLAVDGWHYAKLTERGVELNMIDVDKVEEKGPHHYVNTGSPHHIVWTEDLQDLNIREAARAIRYNEEYATEGVNVNFVKKIEPGQLQMRTYERGVEDETLSCGTGVTAAALAATTFHEGEDNFSIQTPGGTLSVRFRRNGGGFTDIWLVGPAEFVFKGEIQL